MTCGICVGSDHADQSTFGHNNGLCPFALASGNQVGVEFLAESGGWCGSDHCAASPEIEGVWLYTDSPSIVAGVPQESTGEAPDVNGELKADILKLGPGDGGNGTVNLVVRCGTEGGFEGGFESPVTGTDTTESGDDMASSSLTGGVDTGRKVAGVDQSGFEGELFGISEISGGHKPVK